MAGQKFALWRRSCRNDIYLEDEVDEGPATEDAIFSYDLDIMPILMKFDSHSEIDFPLEAVDRNAFAAWFDDQIVEFVRTYLSLHENQYYLKGHMVEDPIAKIQFPKFAAGATCEHNGKTIYFVDEKTRATFVEQAAEKKK